MKFVIYPDAKSEWRWRLKADNNKTIADSGEGYKKELDCRGGITLVMSTDTTTPIVKVATMADLAKG